MEEGNMCTICGTLLQETDTDKITLVKSKGLETFINKSQCRKDGLHERWEGKESVRFHESCRQRYSALKLTEKRKRDSSELPPLNFPTATNVSIEFNFDEYCFICNKLLDRIHKKVSTLQHLYTYNNLVLKASKRNDELGVAVSNRLINTPFRENYFQYHYLCYKHFLYDSSKAPLTEQTAEPVPEIHNENPQPPNAPSNDDVFEAICEYMEESGKFRFSLSELQGLNNEKISNKVLCNRLEEKYNDDIYILKHRGRETLIYFQKIDLTQTCSDWVTKKSISNFEKNAIIHFAAEILKFEIINGKYENSTYPPAENFLDNVNSEIPELLQNFLYDLLLDKAKKKSTEETRENRHDCA
ncbi:uncharacterized protein LOC131665949 [Phymastichus coffea]|uniref:uncharacterized protein LOC131665949 n=1 Tax=Phymastichus coffea TaxID=108790 RepID=UPI00273CA997|nr:uncharacterized protein LOC131665949 [Phymastichus coffea]